MTCEPWLEKLDAYLDGELANTEAHAMAEHLRGCPGCAAESLNRLQLGWAVRSAGHRYTPDAAFRARIQNSIAPRRRFHFNLWLPALAGAMALLIIGTISFMLSRSRAGEQQVLSELTDLHVATLASANPVDVVSTDRHTVKPWFEGKIPFTFNLPDLQNSPFTLVGGKVAYLEQSPGAELIFRVRQHEISVFIFQEKALVSFGTGATPQRAQSFNLRSWSHNGLRYFVISDVAAEDIEKLTGLLTAAN